MRSGSGVIGAELWHWGGNSEMRGEYMSAGVQVDVVNVSYSVIVSKKKKQLLKDVTVRLDPGDMCALMGPSGAGKSTLLDLIADRKLSGIWSGEILVNSRPRSPFFNRDTAYVLQDDVHIATLTVRETLMYAARMRMEEGTTAEQRFNRVKAIMQMLSMQHIADSIVGDAMIKGISGGQLKRLSIGVEIIPLPNLIFLDEPTSGLDSAISLEVMKAVSILATQNRTIISTIHQPSPETFALFDKVVLLSAGRLIFVGPADEAVAYFTRPELDYRYDPNQNPAEFIIEVSGGVIYPNGREFPRRPEELAEIFQASSYCLKPGERTSVTGETPLYTRKHATGKLTQIRALFHRTFTQMSRSKAEIRMNLGKNIIVGVLVGIVFWGQGDCGKLLDVDGNLTPEAINLSNLLFFFMMYTVMANLQAIPNLCSMNVLYRRELSAYAYASFPYWLANVIVPLPFLLVYHIVNFNIVYWTVEFPREFNAFLYTFFITAFSNIVSFYFAQLLAAGFGSQQLALAVFPVTFLFFSMFAGFSIKLPDVPEPWEWATYISYPRYIYEGLLVENYRALDVSGTHDALKIFGFDGWSPNDSIAIAALFGVIFSLLTYLFLRPPTSKLVHTNDKSQLVEAKPATTNNGKGDMEAPLLDKKSFDDPNKAFPSKSTYDVQWYRQSTGEVQLSRGCRLVFRDLEYFVNDKADKKKKLQLLKGVSGRAHPGEMCALMGASGAGKSTLLDVLAGRKTTGEIKGDILFNGSPRNAAITRSSAYVMQDNVHIGVLTVRQTLTFAAALRMDEHFKPQARDQRVDKILDMLGLQEVSGSIVGTHAIRGISGGQLKRLSIGVEIINLPDLIYLDEPTTGLDSAIAFEVMAAVRNLANQNRTVICTIHQPSPQTYDLFDKLMLLADGRVIYFGPAREVVTFFVTSPFQFAFVQGSNPADFVINVAGSFIPASNGKFVPGAELAQYYSKSDLYRMFIEHIDTMIAMDLAAVVWNNKEVDTYPTSTRTQLRVLVKRQLLKTLKDRKPTTTAFMRHVLVAAFYGSIYWHLGNDYNALLDKMALFFFALLFMILGHQQAIPILFEERLLFYRERGANCYSTLPYWVSGVILALPLTLLNVLIFCAILSDMSGLDGDFGYMFFIMLMCSYAGLFQAQAIAAATPTAQTAIAVFPASLFWSVAFSGFIVYIPTLETWLRVWAPYLSFMRWGFEGLITNEFEDIEGTREAKVILDNLGFENFDKWLAVPYILIFVLAFRWVTYFALDRINFEQR